MPPHMTRSQALTEALQQPNSARFCDRPRQRAPLCSVPGAGEKNGKLSRRPLVRTDAADMLERAALPAHYSPHSFRATGITNFLKNDGTLEAAQRIAGHADSRTTKLYDRRGQKVLLEIWREFDTS
jgi:site-specific recombinase XerC